MGMISDGPPVRVVMCDLPKFRPVSLARNLRLTAGLVAFEDQQVLFP